MPKHCHYINVMTLHLSWYLLNIKTQYGLENYTQWGQEMNNCLFCMYGLIVSAALVVFLV